ncbi:MAG: ornithine carbamoyltransferase [Mariprofundales bacterium]|nr:ornithine carbamoyltransferase [Mariprofundales bacterium]
MKHFLQLTDLNRDQGQWLMVRAAKLKEMRKQGSMEQTLTGKTLGMLFDKASTRTRVSFETGMFQLGGHAVFLHSSTSQLGRGEAVADSARVLSSMVDIITIRTFSHEMVEQFAKHSAVPVINALTDYTHPCQILADVMTFEEHRNNISNKTVAWIGDGNNMAHSWINGAALFGYHLRLACPEGYQPDSILVTAARTSGASITLTTDPKEAAERADLVTTDVWSSMGQESEQREREVAFANFQVDGRLMSLAKPTALFMHCLPAHRGEEVTAEVIDGPQSVVWSEAENRLHTQKALLELLLTPKAQQGEQQIESV